MDDTLPNPLKNFTPRANPQKQAQSAATQDPPLTAAELARLAGDNDALRALAKGKLVEIIRNVPALPGLVPAIKELLDRIDGKAKERIEANITGQMVHFNVHEGAGLILAGIKEKLAKRSKLNMVIEHNTISSNDDQAIDK